MQTLSSWTPWLLAVTLSFLVGSLVSCLTYCIARLPSTPVLWMRRVFCVLACLMMLVTSAGLLATSPTSVLCALLLTLGASGVQSALEFNIDGGSASKKRQFARSFLTSVCSATLVLLALIVVVYLVVNPTRPNVWWAWAITPGVGGVGAGLLLAPLSISFCRSLFQSLHLRPGMERSLREEELTR